MVLDLYRGFHLFLTPSRFYIQPNENKDEALIIDRGNCEINTNKMFSVGLLPANATSLPIEGIIGIKHLLKCPYLIVITKKHEIGTIEHEPIYKMLEWKIIPFSTSEDQHDDSTNKWNDIYVQMINSVLSMKSYYFSYRYDLTNSMQRRSLLKNTNNLKAQHLYDARFSWNDHLMKDFDESPTDTNKYRLPFILGYINISPGTLGPRLSWIFISRRSTRRAGTRFHSRGIDQDGNVSNFVETEQILEDLQGTFTTSFLQIRGSIPLVWSQHRDFRWKPPIEFDPHVDHDFFMSKHFSELKNLYGGTSVVNLIDSKGHEAILAQQFNSREKTDMINHYHYFDFHSRRKENPLALEKLLEDLMSDIKEYGFFAISNGQVKIYQKGVIRTNCIDCLDRTNVVQSMISEAVLSMQLVFLDIFPSGTSLRKDSHFMQIFRMVWTDNADAISVQYAGTPALKTDITRYGKRSVTGPLNDGQNSVMRYIANNFLDDYRQDAIDLYLGKFHGPQSPIYRPLSLPSYTSTTSVSLIAFILVALYIYLRFWNQTDHYHRP